MRSKLTVLALLLSILMTLSAIPLLARSIHTQSASAKEIFGTELPSDISFINGFVTPEGRFAQLRTSDDRVRIDFARASADARCAHTNIDISNIEQSCLEPVLSRFLLAQVNPKRSRQIEPLALALGTNSVNSIKFELPDEHFYWLAQIRANAESSLVLAHTRKKALSTQEFRQILHSLPIFDATF